MSGTGQETTETTGLAQGIADNTADVENVNETTDNNDVNVAENNSETEETTDNGETETENNTDNGVYGAPEAYDFKGLELPEGYSIDEELAQEFAPIGKELNLSQESANKLATLLVASQQKMLSKMSQQFAEYKKQEQKAVNLGYEKLLNEDKEIGGGDKNKMNAYLDVADLGYNSFATDELKTVFSGLHLDYHPAVIKLFYRLGKLCGNDKITQANAPVGAKQSTADIIYSKKTEE